MRTVRLDEIVTIVGGGTPSRANKEFWGGNIPWVSVKDFRGPRISQSQETITEKGLASSASNLIEPNTILIPTRMALGKVAISDVPLAINQDIKALKINCPDEINVNYLAHFISSRSDYIASKGKGATVKGITLDILRQLPVPLPPIKEQKRIAEILGRADALRAKRRQAIDKINELTQSIFLEMFGDPVTNPKGLQSAPLPEICNLYSGGTPSKSNKDFWIGDLPWFSPKDLKKNDLFDSIDHISPIVPSKTNLRLLPPDTVVIVVRGMILAHSFPVSVLRIPATINQDMKALLPKTYLHPQFLASCLRAQRHHALAQVSDSAHGTKRIDAAGLSKIPILLPSKADQDEFGRRALAVFSLLNSSIESKDMLDNLFSSLQQRAFSGEL